MNPNRGQWDSRVLYALDIDIGRMFIDNQGITYHLSDALSHHHQEKSSSNQKIKYHTIKQKFINNNWKGDYKENHPSKHYNNYILGNDSSKWKSKVHGFKEVQLNKFCDKVDLFYDSRGDGMLYGFKLSPGANINDLSFKIEGADTVIIDDEGDLHITHSFGEIMQSAPRAWLKKNKKKVRVHFELKGDLISFVLPEGYNQEDTLIIDPSLTFSTFSGSTSDNWGFTATPDSYSNLFGGGIVFGFGYPTTTGAYDVSFNLGIGSFPMDIGITKFSANGSSLLYSTYIGGEGSETPHSLVASDNGELFIYGVTCSPNFPMAGASFDNSFNGGPYLIENSLDFDGSDIFVARLSANGASLISSTYVGGSGTDGLNINSLKYNYGDQFRGEITLDASGNVYVSSTTSSADFPITMNAFQTNLNGLQDAVLFKMPPTLNSIIWSSYFGGLGQETGNSIQVSDATGELCIAGGTNSNTLPMSIGEDLTFNGGISDGYAARFNSTSGALLSGTFMGFAEYDQTYFVQYDINNDIYVYGQTESPWPLSAGCYGIPNSGQYIRKYNNDLTGILWTTMIGAGTGHVEISPTAFLVSNCFDIYLAGWGGTLNANSFWSQAVNSSTNGFPVSTTQPNVGYQLTTNGSNFYIAVLEPDATGLKYGTFMGGLNSSSNHVDGGTSRFDKSGRIYHAVCGGCGGNPTGFTSTTGSWSQFNQSSNCNMATFKFELSSIDAVVPAVAPLICIPQPVVFQNSSTNGNTYLWDFGDGTTSGDFAPTHFYTSPGIYTVQLLVTDSSGCFSPDSVSLTVTIGDFQGGVIQPTSPICPGESFPLEAYGGTNYEWSPANVLSNAFISNPVAVVNVTTQFTVIISDSCGSDTLQLTLPVHSQSISISNDTSVCLGGSIPLMVTGPGTVSWDPPGSLNDPFSFNPIATPDSMTTYVATVTSLNNCIYTDTVTIDVNYNPPIPVLADTLFFCVGTVLSVNVSGGDTYLWTPQNAFITPFTGDFVTVSPPSEMWFFCEVTNSCGSSTDSVFIIPVQPQITAGNDTIICPGEIASLWANGASYYQWFPVNALVSFSSAGAEVSPLTSTNFMVVGTDQTGCKDTAFVQVDLFPNPSVQVPSSIIAFYGDQVPIFATSQTSGVFSWSPPEFLSCVNCANPIASPNQNITYTVHFVDMNGCTAENHVSISYQSIIYVPNTFTPHEDGVNDLFGVYGGNIKKMKMLIFNRWGELVYTLNDINEFWDGTYNGKECQDGTYVWRLVYEDMQQHAHELTGHVNIIR